jgi:EAL domain-containing protein (putative c-di-GMP-specific phosphodiesterase class I)
VTVAVAGIESEEQADWWRELGCDVGAGPYFD